jgi:hypothetical protein
MGSAVHGAICREDMTHNSRIPLHTLAVLSAAFMTTAGFAKTAANAAPKLTPDGDKAMAEYTGMLDRLRADLKAKLPQIDKTLEVAFLTIYEKEKGAMVSGKDKNGKPTQSLKGGNYSNPAAAPASLEAAKPILASIDRFLSSNSLDAELAKCAVLTDATPQALAMFAERGAAEKKLIGDLLADPKLMKEMLYAGGAKAGRYGESMRILRAIEAQSPRAKEGLFKRLALATALEFAAPELCGYKDVDPLKRYAFYEKSYLDKELDPHFDKHSIWLLRHVVNDPHPEEDMLWMREMLWNYRPDQINAPDEYNAHVVGLMYSEFGHRKAPEGETGPPYTKNQQFIDRGSICGGKGGFGRCLGRTFGIPVWGARLRGHTAMTYWTPKSWETILGVSFENGYWIVDQVEPMRGIYFLNLAYARDYPDEFVKACRAQWAGAVLGEEKVSGYDSGKGGLWNALALNAMRATVATHVPPPPPRKVLAPGEPKPKEPKGYPERLVKPVVPAALKKVTIDKDGVITLPAVACASPTTNTDKVVFMTTRDGGMNLHYKRWEMPEPFTYEIDVPQAGDYALSAKVVTVNREQFFLVKVNQATQPIRMEIPYTVGKWGETQPVTIALTKGRNVLAFTRTAPADFLTEGYRFAGPEYGGITIQSFMLKPAKGQP